MAAKFKFYGADWCGDCNRIKLFLEQKDYNEYEYIDIEEDESASDHVIEVNPEGNRSIPVLEFPDGETMIEPSVQEVASKLGIE